MYIDNSVIDIADIYELEHLALVNQIKINDDKNATEEDKRKADQLWSRIAFTRHLLETNHELKLDDKVRKQYTNIV